jgi:hypothetical protein
MAGHTLRVIVTSVQLERFVGIMTCGTTYSAIVGVTLAVEDAIRLKPNVVDLHAL